MAYKKTVQGRPYPFLYNVSMTVGTRKEMHKEQIGQGITGTSLTSWYMPNKRDDVMLVQYLLKRVYQQGETYNPPLRGNGTKELKIDGMYGLQTQSAIEHFQLDMRRYGRNIATDGCVDSELGNSPFSSISKTGYTISWLNRLFWDLYPELAPDIRLDPECPPELKQAVGNGGF